MVPEAEGKKKLSSSINGHGLACFEHEKKLEQYNQRGAMPSAGQQPDQVQSRLVCQLGHSCMFTIWQLRKVGKVHSTCDGLSLAHLEDH